MRKRIIAGNWKMNKTCSETTKLCEELKDKLSNVNDIEIIICPPFTSLGCAALTLKDSNIKVGAQNMYFEDSGAFTGEVSPLMLKELNVEYVIIGHSERRENFGENNELVNKKIKKALEIGLKPIVCIGEKLEEREADKTKEIILTQINEGFAYLKPEEMKNIIIAYEPIWAIGTGKTATPEQAQEMHAYIREILKEMFDKETSQSVIIQYGGSMKPENAKELLNQVDIDGGLIGGASLIAEKFEQIIRS